MYLRCGFCTLEQRVNLHESRKVSDKFNLRAVHNYQHFHKLTNHMLVGRGGLMPVLWCTHFLIDGVFMEQSFERSRYRITLRNKKSATIQITVLFSMLVTSQPTCSVNCCATVFPGTNVYKTTQGSKFVTLWECADYHRGKPWTFPLFWLFGLGTSISNLAAIINPL